MSSVKIRPNGRGGYTLLVDDHDISDLVAADGIDITFRRDAVIRRFGDRDDHTRAITPTVTITLAECVDVDLELPDALASIVARPAEGDES